jgi:hypothetical protein
LRAAIRSIDDRPRINVTKPVQTMKKAGADFDAGPFLFARKQLAFIGLNRRKKD